MENNSSKMIHFSILRFPLECKIIQQNNKTGTDLVSTVLTNIYLFKVNEMNPKNKMKFVQS